MFLFGLASGGSEDRFSCAEFNKCQPIHELDLLPPKLCLIDGLAGLVSLSDRYIYPKEVPHLQ